MECINNKRKIVIKYGNDFLCSIIELDINIKTCYNINMKGFSIKNAIILALTFKYDRRRVVYDETDIHYFDGGCIDYCYFCG